MQGNLDYKEIIVTAAQKIISGEASQVLSEEKVAALENVYSKCEAYQQDGFASSLVSAISSKKCEFILNATTKTELKEIMEPAKVRYNGNEVVSYGKYSVLEEEAIIWSKTSLQAPLNEVGFQRYMLLVKKFFPDKAKEILGDRYPRETGVIEINDSEVQIIETGEAAEQVIEVGGIIAESNTDETAATVTGIDETNDVFDELDEIAASEDEPADDIDPESETDDENTDTADDTDGDEILSDEDDEESEDESVEDAETAAPATTDTVVKTPVIEINENTVSQAIEKLEKEANTSGGQNVPAIPIYNYLKKVCEADITFAALVNQAHKTLLKRGLYFAALRRQLR